MKNILFTFVLLVAFLSACAPSQAQLDKYSTQTQQAIPTNTNTPEPTSTPKPTSTPRPTPTMTQMPDPVEFSGTGSKVIDFVHPWTGPTILKITNSGSRNFIIESYDSNNEKIDLLVNEIGSYSGVLLTNVMNGDPEITRLSIESSGSWIIKAIPFNIFDLDKLSVPGTFEGDGDNVLVVVGKPDLLTLTCNQQNYIGVYSYSDDGRDLLFNEVGPYTGQVILPNGTFLLEVHSSGKWQIDVTER